MGGESSAGIKFGWLAVMEMHFNRISVAFPLKDRMISAEF